MLIFLSYPAQKTKISAQRTYIKNNIKHLHHTKNIHNRKAYNIYLQLTKLLHYTDEGWLGFPDLWSGQKPWWNWYLTPVVNFGQVRWAQLVKSALLISSLVPLGSFQIFYGLFRCSRESGVQKARGSYRTYSSLVKLQPRFLSLQWKTCLWAELQP